MSYSESNGQVTLTMSRDDYSLLLILLGAVTVPPHVPFRRIHETFELLNRLNEGNPHYTPYQVEAKKS